MPLARSAKKVSIAASPSSLSVPRSKNGILLEQIGQRHVLEQIGQRPIAIGELLQVGKILGGKTHAGAFSLAFAGAPAASAASRAINLSSRMRARTAATSDLSRTGFSENRSVVPIMS